MPKLHLRRFAPAAALAVALLALAACGGEYPNSTFSKNTELNEGAVFLWDRMMLLGTIVFVIVEVLLVYTIFKFRRREGGPAPRQIHGNAALEITWTAIPALILVFLAVPTVKTIFENQRKAPAEALQVEVIGHQWWWEFRYPQYGLITANELHVPTGRTVSLRMITQDVLHSFWLPQLAAKRDVFQQRTTTLWFTAEKEGLYPGQCTEFCGIQHGRMAFQVVAQSPQGFEEYVAALKASAPAPVPVPAPTDSAKPTALAGTTTTTLGATTLVADSTQGAQLFMMKGCVGCHSLDATKVMGIGPNLAGIGTRKYIAAGWLENTDANLAKWIQHPQDVKTGVLMPNLGLTDAEAQTLAAYLRQH